MLGGERQNAYPNDTIPAPTIGQTFKASFIQPLEQASQLTSYILPGATSEETRLSSANRLANINEILSDPRQGYTQMGLNAVANIAGATLATIPAAMIASSVGGLGATAIGFGARSLAVATAAETDVLLLGYLATQVSLEKMSVGAMSKWLPRASAAEIATGTVEAFGAYKGMTIPEHFAENYNAVNDELDTNQAISDWSADNYGFLFGAVPLAAGYVLFKGVRGVLKARKGVTPEAEMNRLVQDHKEVLKENETAVNAPTPQDPKVSELQFHLQESEDAGHITPKMHQWYLDYLENPNDMDKVHKGGMDILKDLDIHFDASTGRVWNQLISRDGVKQFKNALVDEMSTNMGGEDGKLLSNYIIHNELDNYKADMQKNPNFVLAMQGMVHSMESKIDSQAIALKIFDEKLTRELPKGTLKKQIFSQNNLYEHLKKMGVSRASDVPYHVPYKVSQKLKLVEKAKKTDERVKYYSNKINKEQKVRANYKEKIESFKERRDSLKKAVPKGNISRLNLIKKINDAELNIKDYTSRLNSLRKTNAQEKMDALIERSKKLKKSIKEMRLTNPAEELIQIRDKLLPNGKLVNDYKSRRAFHRLEDLSQVWPDAKVLLDRVHMEQAHVKQKALNEILKKFIEMVDSNAPRFANPDRVKRYLVRRVEEATPVAREFSRRRVTDKIDEAKVIKPVEEKPTEPTEQETAQERVIADTELEFARDDHHIAEAKIKQLSENRATLEELITCSLGE